MELDFRKCLKIMLYYKVKFNEYISFLSPVSVNCERQTSKTNFYSVLLYYLITLHMCYFIITKITTLL